MSEEATELLRKKYPYVLIIINVVAKRVEMILTNILTAVVVIYFEQHSVPNQIHKQIWEETGKHFQDLVQTNQIIEKEINNDSTNN